jgi:NAD-dependent deacetylase
MRQKTYSQSNHSEEFEAVRQLLQEAERVLFVTGAGMSADSGLPTYRGIGGLYEESGTDEGFAIEEAISGDMLRRRPDITWKYLRQIGNACREASFNEGHTILAEIEKAKPESWVLTQNIDGFHRLAGSQNVIEIHGTLDRVSCMRCNYRCAGDEVNEAELPPKCPECDDILRPDVVLFGEMLPENELRLLNRIYERGFDLVFSIGTTSVFPYIAQPVWQANEWKIPAVEINPSQTQVSGLVDYHFQESASEVLRNLWNG